MDPGLAAVDHPGGDQEEGSAAEAAAGFDNFLQPVIAGEATMPRSFSTALVLMIALSTGCASSHGFDRATINEALHLDPAPDQHKPPNTHQEPTPAPPVRLGIFFADHDFPNRQSIRKVEWLSTDRDQLLHELAPLRDEQLLAETFVLMDATLRGDDIDGIRQAGARYGADLVLIVDGAAAVDRYNNRYAWLYPTLLGAYLAPGTESDALVMATASLWAVRSEWHASVVTVEGVSKLVGSAVFVEDNAALQKAKQQAIQFLSQRISDQLQRLNK